MLPLADCVPGAIGTTSKNWLRLVGMFASVSWLRLVLVPACVASTTGAWPETVTVSCSALTVSCCSISIVRPASTRMPSRLSVAKPGRLKVTV